MDILERSFDNARAEIATVVELPALAFVDVETTGLRPSEDRIAEIGVVTVDGDRIERWGTLLRTPSRRRPLDSAIDAHPRDEHDDAPTFADIAAALAHRLAGRLFIAHNARFDYAFVRAELDRVGIFYEPQVVCSVMLSRALYPELCHHNLDALAHRHGLVVEERHRALPDAELLWQWWRKAHRDHSARTIRRTIARLLAGPTLPSSLDPALLERLPARPGAYVLHGVGNDPIVVGAAANLRLHLLHYFRIDHATTRALQHAHRIENVTWRVTDGIIGARLAAARLDAAHFSNANRRLAAPLLTWRFLPASIPCVTLAPLATVADDDAATYGMYASERKARNALGRLADRHELSRALLGLDPGAGWRDCPARQPTSPPTRSVAAKQELLRIFDALRTLKVPGWPHAGPIGIRERNDLHVVDRWRYLGTARTGHDLHELLDGSRPEFDVRIFRLLQRTLARLPPRKLVDLAKHASAAVPN